MNFFTFALKITILDRKIKVSAVSYLNTKPLLYGIQQHELINNIDLTLEYPALIAKHLQDNSIDLGLVPVAAIPHINHARIISDYGIAAKGKVASVCIFSQKPLENIQKVYLDYQSRTSVQLARILLKEFWKKEVIFMPAPDNYITLIDDHTAGVIIGDRALESLNKFAYVYDLAEAWQSFTGLPFVFAAWVANKELPESFVQQFNQANAKGLDNLDKIVAATPYPIYDLNVYYRENIHYRIDDEKRRGLNLFLQYITTGSSDR